MWFLKKIFRSGGIKKNQPAKHAKNMKRVKKEKSNRKFGKEDAKTAEILIQRKC